MSEDQKEPNEVSLNDAWNVGDEEVDPGSEPDAPEEGTTEAEQGQQAQQPQEEKPKAEEKPKSRKRSAPRRKSAPTQTNAGKPVNSENMANVLKKQEQVMLMIQEMENPPPNGVFVSINGYAYQILPGKWVKVPKSVVEILENAVETKSVVQDGRIIGHRNVPRYPFNTKPVQ